MSETQTLRKTKQSPRKVSLKRPVYRVDMNELLKFAALLNSGGVRRPYTQRSIELLRRCVYKQTGNIRSALTDLDITRLIERGYKLTG